MIGAIPMPQREMPTINNASHSHAVYDARTLHGPLIGQRALSQFQPRQDSLYETVLATAAPDTSLFQAVTQGARAMAANPPRRVVQVFIVDPDSNVPLDGCLIYQSEARMTDLTDQELFYEIDIRKLLEEHNKLRGKLHNKAVTARTEYLEPVRIRDLKMTVTTIATF
jgi:hypothetical protein